MAPRLVVEFPKIPGIGTITMIRFHCHFGSNFSSPLRMFDLKRGFCQHLRSYLGGWILLAEETEPGCYRRSSISNCQTGMWSCAPCSYHICHRGPNGKKGDSFRLGYVVLWLEPWIVLLRSQWHIPLDQTTASEAGRSSLPGFCRITECLLTSPETRKQTKQ